MFGISRVAISVFILIFGHFHAAVAADPADYGALPAFEDVRISPDGKTVAFIQNFADGARAVIFKPLAGGETTGARIGPVKARQLIWASNDHVMLQVSRTETVNTTAGIQTYELWRWVAIKKNGDAPSYMFSGDRRFGRMISAGALLATTPDDPKSVVMAHYQLASQQSQQGGPSRLGGPRNDAGAYSLFRVNLNSGKETRIFVGEEDTLRWLVDKTGEPRVRVDYDEQREEMRFYRREAGSDRFSLVSTRKEERGSFELRALSLTSDPDVIIVSSYGGENTLGLLRYNIVTGEYAGELWRNPRYDLDSFKSSNDHTEIIGVVFTDHMDRTDYFDESLQKLQRSLSNVIPNSTATIVSYSDDFNKMIVRVDYPDFPGQYFFFDRNTSELAKIAARYPQLEGAQVAEKTVFDYTASDGVRIPGYVTFPKGAERRNLPLIVLPHGGPEGRDDQSFDWWSFFYAAQGYAVYQPNFRGSDGYGWQFRKSGFGQWGRRMQDDITEGVQQLVADGVADPSRICIVGASYGGYAALAGATLTPQRYACAVSVNGISDLPEMLGREAISSSLAEDYWEIRIGSRFNDTEALNAVSPAFHASAVVAPIQLIVSKDDVVVPPMQSSAMRTALEAAGKPFVYVELEGEDHWLSLAPTRTRMLEESMRFIDEHIGR